MDAAEWNRYELIPLLAYSPAPSDFFLFPNLKKDIRGCHFLSDEEVMTAVEEWVSGKDPDFFSSGLMTLENSWSKCITLEGNYMEKEEVDLNGKKVRLVTYWLALVCPLIHIFTSFLACISVCRYCKTRFSKNFTFLISTWFSVNIFCLPITIIFFGMFSWYFTIMYNRSWQCVLYKNDNCCFHASLVVSHFWQICVCCLTWIPFEIIL